MQSQADYTRYYSNNSSSLITTTTPMAESAQPMYTQQPPLYIPPDTNYASSSSCPPPEYNNIIIPPDDFIGWDDLITRDQIERNRAQPVDQDMFKLPTMINQLGTQTCFNDYDFVYFLNIFNVPLWRMICEQKLVKFEKDKYFVCEYLLLIFNVISVLPEHNTYALKDLDKIIKFPGIVTKKKKLMSPSVSKIFTLHAIIIKNVFNTLIRKTENHHPVWTQNLTENLGKLRAAFAESAELHKNISTNTTKHNYEDIVKCFESVYPINKKTNTKRKQDSFQACQPKRPSTQKDLGKLMECMNKDNEDAVGADAAGVEQTYEKIAHECVTPPDSTFEMDLEMLDNLNEFFRATTANMPLTNPISTFASIYDHVHSVYVHDCSLCDFRQHLAVMNYGADAAPVENSSHTINLEFNEMKSWLMANSDISDSVYDAISAARVEMMKSFVRHFATVDAVVGDIGRIYDQMAAFFSESENNLPPSSGDRINLRQVKNVYLGHEPPRTTELQILIYKMWSKFKIELDKQSLQMSKEVCDLLMADHSRNLINFEIQNRGIFMHDIGLTWVQVFKNLVFKPGSWPNRRD
uniref:Uncharacterized protein n=1 Tax=Cacopsylla melanoneura TaxID=428564 RepID=A0A8D9AH74_9HEMI